MARSAQMNLRVRPTRKAKLEKLAKERRRTLSAYIEKLLEDHVKRAFQVGVEDQKQAKHRSVDNCQPGQRFTLRLFLQKRNPASRHSAHFLMLLKFADVDYPQS